MDSCARKGRSTGLNKMFQSAYIKCACGSCGLILVEDKPLCHLACACEDCARFMQYLHSSGGGVPVDVVRAYYIRAYILDVFGIDYMGSLKLGSDSETIRTYCKECFSVLGIYHKLMRDSVFASWPDFCEMSYNLSVPISAYIYVTDPLLYAELSGEEIPIIGSLYSKSEFKKFIDIEEVAHTFKPTKNVSEAIRFKDLLERLGEPKVIVS